MILRKIAAREDTFQTEIIVYGGNICFQCDFPQNSNTREKTEQAGNVIIPQNGITNVPISKPLSNAMALFKKLVFSLPNFTLK